MSAESGPQFVDSNVLVYAYDSTAGEKRVQAGELLRTLWADRNGRISIQVIQEFYFTVTGKLQRPLPQAEAALIVGDMGHWPVHSPRVADVLSAIRLQERYQISFWDAMIVCSAQQLGCGVLWSEDLNAGQRYGDVKVRNPFASAAE
ncbi:MAG: PIN domain-containing protein [Candidatus Promineifilaceae bacterium]|jgi:predicted nucleic acid-binding protein